MGQHAKSIARAKRHRKSGERKGVVASNMRKTGNQHRTSLALDLQIVDDVFTGRK